MTSTPGSLTVAAFSDFEEIDELSIAFALAEEALTAAGFGYTTECVGPERVCPRLLSAMAA